MQSFETANLRMLDRVIDTPLVQLLGSRTSRPYDLVKTGDRRTYGHLATPAGPRHISRYADGVGPSKDYIVPRDSSGASKAPTTVVRAPTAPGCSSVPTPSETRTPSCRASCEARAR